MRSHSMIVSQKCLDLREKQARGLTGLCMKGQQGCSRTAPQFAGVVNLSMNKESDRGRVEAAERSRRTSAVVIRNAKPSLRIRLPLQMPLPLPSTHTFPTRPKSTKSKYNRLQTCNRFRPCNGRCKRQPTFVYYALNYYLYLIKFK